MMTTRIFYLALLLGLLFTPFACQKEADPDLSTLEKPVQEAKDWFEKTSTRQQDRSTPSDLLED